MQPLLLFFSLYRINSIVFVKKIGYLLLCFCMSISTLSAQATSDSLSLHDIDIQQLEKEITALELSAHIFAEQKDFTNAVSVLDSAVMLSIRTENHKKQASLLTFQGEIYCKNDRYLLAEHSLKHAQKLLVELNTDEDSALICKVYNNLGIIYRRKDNYDEALKYHLNAEKIARKKNELQQHAISLNSLGLILVHQKNYEGALRYFEEALTVETQTHNELGVAINLNSIAWAYQEIGDYHKAEDFYKKAEEANRELKNNEGIAICRRYLGTLYVLKKDYKTAAEYFKKSIDYFEERGDTRNYCLTAFEYAKLFIIQGNNESAIDLLLSVNELASSLHQNDLLHESYLKLSKIYENIGDNAKALRYLQTSNIYSDSIHNTEAEQFAEEIETKYRLQESNDEIEYLTGVNAERRAYISRMRIIGFGLILSLIAVVILLIRIANKRNKFRELAQQLEINNTAIVTQKEYIAEQNRMLEQQTEELQKINSTKDKFFSIIAHDLRNPFNALIGFSDLLTENYESYTDAERKEIIRTLNKSAQSAHRLQDNLFSWARSQSGALQVNPEQFDIREIIVENIEQAKIRAANKGILIHNSIPLREISIFADKNMINTVIRNILSNAVKFTNLGGHIELSVEKKADNIEISVKDNGIGISDDVQKKLFNLADGNTRRGTNNEPGSGLGLVLCREFVLKNNGTIRVKSAVGAGTEFRVSLPLHAQDNAQ